MFFRFVVPVAILVVVFSSPSMPLPAIIIIVFAIAISIVVAVVVLVLVVVVVVLVVVVDVVAMPCGQQGDTWLLAFFNHSRDKKQRESAVSETIVKFGITGMLLPFLLLIRHIAKTVQQAYCPMA